MSKKSPKLYMSYGLDYCEITDEPVPASAAIEQIYQYFFNSYQIQRHQITTQGKADGKVKFTHPSSSIEAHLVPHEEQD